MKKLRALCVGTVILVVGGSGALAQRLDKKLKGDYDFTTSLHCLSVDDPGDFDPFFRPIGAVAFHRNMSSVGVRTFNGDGTSSLVARVFVQRFDRTDLLDGGAISVLDIDCPDGTYEVFSDGSFEQSYGHCTGVTVEPAGLPGGQPTFVVDNITTGGQIGNGGKTLLIYDVGTDVQEGDSGKSICARSGSAIKR